VCPSFSRKEVEVSVYKSLIRWTNSSPAPASPRAIVIASCGIASNAFVISSEAKQRSFLSFLESTFHHVVVLKCPIIWHEAFLGRTEDGVLF
jgi:L-lactate utilization protein LutC